MHFEIIGQITDITAIAAGSGIRIGSGHWRKLKGIATIRLVDGTIRSAEVHWFEAHGIGKIKMRVKRFLD